MTAPQETGPSWEDRATAAVEDTILSLLSAESGGTVDETAVIAELLASHAGLVDERFPGERARGAEEIIGLFDQRWLQGSSDLEGLVERPDPARFRFEVAATDPTEVRRIRVQRVAETWISQLLDTSGHNRLLFYKELKTGTLNLTAATRTPLKHLLEDRPVDVTDLFPDSELNESLARDTMAVALRKAKRIFGQARENLEERGIDTLYLSSGLATWEPQSSAVPASPVVLRPSQVTPKGVSGSDYEISATGEWELNEALLQYLTTTFGASDQLNALQAELDAIGEIDHSNLDRVFGAVRRFAAEVPGFAINDSVILGNFQYRKLPMVRDLQNNVDALAAHDLVSALAGVTEAVASIRNRDAPDISERDPDTQPPQDEYLVLDADSSQSFAINSVVAGQSLVIQGPPGTGKSQTIANLIATSVARGKRVLFVAEKRAAIEAVTKRLTEVGLRDVVMDLHGGVTSKKQFAANLRSALESHRAATPVQRSDQDELLTNSRRALSSHSDALHEVRSPWGISVHDAQSALLGLTHVQVGDLMLRSTQIRNLDAATATRVRSELAEWADVAADVLAQTSPWAQSSVTTEADAERALAIVEDLAGDTVPAARKALDEVLRSTGLPVPQSLTAWEEIFTLLNEAQRVLGKVEPTLFEQAASLKPKLQPGTKGTWGRIAAQLTDSEYRTAKRDLKGHWKGQGKPTGKQAAAIVDDVLDLLEDWRRAGAPGVPQAPADLANASQRYAALTDLLVALGAFIASQGLTNRSHQNLNADVDALFEDQTTLFRLPRIHQLETSLTDAHLGDVLESVKEGTTDPDAIVEVFDKMWHQAIRNAVVPRDEELTRFDGAVLTRRREEFQQSDTDHIRSTPPRVRRRIAENVLRVRNAHPEQDALVHREANKRSRHLAPRTILAQAKDVLTALRPCWTMSPLAVSEILPNEQLFDLVIFDEASQIEPADAVPALLRAPQAVVAGDTKQLPPTRFFAKAGSVGEVDEELEDGIFEGFESILDVLLTLVPFRMLTWHYRSEDERLISFSNHKIYLGSLSTFPGAKDYQPVTHELAELKPGEWANTRSSPAEVRRAVELMLDHARERPDESLGVITMGLEHARRIEGQLERELQALADPDLESFFRHDAAERVFVKNIERVQGDERDAIILSVGYSKDDDGKLPYRFGPLMQDGGERRLNVAVTRAKKRLTLLSSFTYADMAPGRSSAQGAELLRQYLRYAASGGHEIEGSESSHPLNPFELDVKQRLENRDIEVHPQFGASGYRIDFALPHPRGSGYVLAVEADGASYHSTPTARDRDRLRQQILEARNWRFHRIWSTDWFNDPEREADKVAAHFRLAVEEIDSGHRQPAEVPPSAPDLALNETVPERKASKPYLGPKRAAIGDYSYTELLKLARWLISDDVLRTREELIVEFAQELGFRKGKRVVERLEGILNIVAPEK